MLLQPDMASMNTWYSVNECISVSVRPHSDQKCSLDMNACPALGISFIDIRVVPLREAEVAEEEQSAQDLLAREVKELHRDDVDCKAMLAYLEDGVLPELER